MSTPTPIFVQPKQGRRHASKPGRGVLVYRLMAVAAACLLLAGAVHAFAG